MRNRVLLSVAAVLMGFAVFSNSAQAETYRLAVNEPLTGSWANFGEGIFNSFKLAIDEANEAKLFGKDKVEVVRDDNAGDTPQGVALATKEGTDPSVVGALCCWVSGLGLASHSVYNRYELPVILSGSNDHRTTRPFHDSKVVFRNSPYDLINMKLAATYAVQIGGFKRIFMVDDNTAFSKTQVEEFSKVAKELGGDAVIIGGESLAVGDSDFSALITKIKDENPDLIYYGGRIVEASLFRQQATKLGLTAPMMTSGGVFSDKFISMTGEAAEGTLASFWGLPLDAYPDGRGVKFKKAYEKAKFNNPYETFGPMAYAAGQVYAQAIAAAQKKGPVTRQAVLNELNGNLFKTLIGDFRFDENGMPDLLHIAIYRVEHGVWKIMYRTDKKATKLLPVK